VHSKKIVIYEERGHLGFLSLIVLLWHGVINMIKSTSWFMKIIVKGKKSRLTKEVFMFKVYKGNWKVLYDQINTIEIVPSIFLQCELCGLSLKELNAICDKIYKDKFNATRKYTFGHASIFYLYYIEK
jgi:hypothetical protein